MMGCRQGNDANEQLKCGPWLVEWEYVDCLVDGLRRGWVGLLLVVEGGGFSPVEYSCHRVGGGDGVLVVAGVLFSMTISLYQKLESLGMTPHTIIFVYTHGDIHTQTACAMSQTQRLIATESCGGETSIYLPEPASADYVYLST
jgi:hypothetical protein